MIPPSSSIRGRWRALAVACAFAFLASCGGGGGSNPPRLRSNDTAGVASVASPPIAGTNVVAIRVDTGTDGTSINTPFVTVRICQPASPGTCVDVDHVVLDTGSSGLRVAASALPAAWLGPNNPAAAPLPAVNTQGRNELAGQCAQFASGFSWGSVRRADVRFGGELAAAIPIQVVNDTTSAAYAAVPAGCAGTGFNIGSGRGAKGILGVGFANEDCGLICATIGTNNVYYGCNAGGGCTSDTMLGANQVRNPARNFGANNNGVVVVLPPVPSGGAGLATGWLLLGIGTQANNALGGATVFAANPTTGNFTTRYKGVNYPNSFIDSGSNGLFFNDASLPSCGDFYCPPAAPLFLSAQNRSDTNVTGTVEFLIDSVTQIRTDAAAAHIAGSNSIQGSFDWGLPFFFGRSVFVAFSGQNTPAGPGPYWAY